MGVRVAGVVSATVAWVWGRREEGCWEATSVMVCSWKPLADHDGRGSRQQSSRQCPHQGSWVVPAPVHDAVDEQGGGAEYLTRRQAALDIPARPGSSCARTGGSRSLSTVSARTAWVWC